MPKDRDLRIAMGSIRVDGPIRVEYLSDIVGKEAMALPVTRLESASGSRGRPTNWGVRVVRIQSSSRKGGIPLVIGATFAGSSWKLEIDR
jgi:hypothetical protein